MMKKKILIVIPRFEVGGTTTSLMNWCTIIDVNKFDLHIFAMSHSGQLKDRFAKFKVLSENMLLAALVTNYKEVCGVFNLILATVIKFIRKICYLFGVDFDSLIYSIVARFILKDKFSTIVAFQEGVATSFSSCLTASNKIAIIRCSYQSYLDVSGLKPEVDIYSSFDTIVAVSQFTRDVFTELIPSLSFKTKAIHNIINTENIITKSKCKELDDKFVPEYFTIISVGRIDPIKRFDLIPRVAAEVKSKSQYKFRWYIIGGGALDDIENISSLISEYNVEDCVCCLGPKSNPYKYICKSDLLVITSASEACPNVLNESKILGIPCLSTDFGSVFEFVDNHETGFICSVDDLSNKLVSIFEDNRCYCAIKSRLSQYRYDNDKIVNDIYSIL